MGNRGVATLESGFNRPTQAANNHYLLFTIYHLRLSKFSPSDSHEERGDARLLVDRLDRFRQKRRDAQDVYLLRPARVVAQRDGVGRHHALNLGLLKQRADGK